jgi:catechol 2,3-dioxygenase-like lactoylglutathione lyase family enzyme
MDLNQISLAVRDLDEGVAFYRLIGLRLIVLDEDSGYARFELPTGTATFSIYVAQAPQPGTATLYFEVDDLDRHHAALVAKGILFDGPPVTESWLWREARFADPTGNRLCLYHAGTHRRFPPWRLDDSDARLSHRSVVDRP